MKPRFERGQADNLETLHPAYFALVMATGIVAIATYLHGVPLLPTILFWLNALFLIILAVAFVARAVRYPAAVAADIRSHSRGVGFFTMVAAAGVFGHQLLLQMNAADTAFFFWIAAGALWLVIMYGELTILTVQPHKPQLAAGLNGGWLVSVVATQSLSILTASMASHHVGASVQQPLVFASLILWLGGGALYMWLMTLIFFRYTFLPMSAADLTPPYWINMGAVAISALAGATLLSEAGLSPLVGQLVPFIKGMTLLLWAIGSWWIPMLLLLGIWRYLVRAVPFAYDPLYWGGVFPLGMYSVCTYRLTQMAGIPFLLPLSRCFMVIALIAWVVTFAGLVDTRLKRASQTRPAH